MEQVVCFAKDDSWKGKGECECKGNGRRGSFGSLWSLRMTDFFWGLGKQVLRFATDDSWRGKSEGRGKGECKSKG